MKTVLVLSSSRSDSCQYPLRRSIDQEHDDPYNAFKVSLM